MDMSRKADLARLYSEMNDISLSTIDRRRAYKAFSKIRLQLQDSELMHLREALVKATYAEDKEWIWKYTNRIKAHLGEQLIEQGEM